MTLGYEDYLAPYACTQKNSRGRLYDEEEGATRSMYQRDRDRVIHCNTFRRLKHKTQVFVFHEGDYYRTRLTHSIEVAQIARSMCRELRLNEDMAETLALAHDFGHTAFGHAGEDALNACMQPYGGFDHNAQSIRLVTYLERRYANFKGLNLTWDTLEGLAKHNGPLIDGKVDLDNLPESIPYGIRGYLKKHDLEIHTFASAEAQIAALSDDIAYNNHDIDDGLRAGLFTLDDLCDAIPFVKEVVDKVSAQYGELDHAILIHEVVRRLINIMIVDVMQEATRRLEALNPKHPDDIRNASGSVVAFSDAMKEREKALKSFLLENMYRHHRVNRMATKGKRVVTELFNLYIEDPECLPREWADEAEGPKTAKTARVVADFIAGMTDRYALRQHQKLFDLSAIEI